MAKGNRSQKKAIKQHKKEQPHKAPRPSVVSDRLKPRVAATCTEARPARTYAGKFTASRHCATSSTRSRW